MKSPKLLRKTGRSGVYECDCGNWFRADVSNVKSGRTKSCGCLWSRNGREMLKRVPRRQATPEGFVTAVRCAYAADSRRKRRVFDLTVEDCKLLFLSPCHWCGCEPSNRFSTSAGTYNNFRYTGIDRKDASVGYVRENCVSCCATCNYAKASMSEAEFMTWITRVYRHRIFGASFVEVPVPQHPPCKRKNRQATN